MPDTLLDQVRGVNPVTGASPGFVESVADDPVTAALAIALRTMPVGSFQAINGDLRTVEASCRAAVDLREKLVAHGLDLKRVKAEGDNELPKVVDDSAVVDADDGRRQKELPAREDPHVNVSTQPENKHVGTDDDVARAREQEALTAKGSSEHPVTTGKASTSVEDKLGKSNKS